jgi:hypothetical protein
MPRSYVRADGERRPLPADQRSTRFYQPQWYDPYFFIQGSMPEKMVMKELVRRGIWFEHTPQTNSINWTNATYGDLKKIASSDPAKWEADFLFPQYKIWLEVQGAYFHTMPGVPEKEALRFAIIEAAGWRPIYWWDYDIEARLPELMDAVPEFYRPKDHIEQGKGKYEQLPQDPKQYPYNRPGPGKKGSARTWGSHLNHPSMAYSKGRNKRKYGGLFFYEGGTGIDHLAGLRKANQNRATTPQFESRRRTKRKSKIRKGYRHRG